MTIQTMKSPAGKKGKTSCLFHPQDAIAASLRYKDFSEYAGYGYAKLIADSPVLLHVSHGAI